MPPDSHLFITKPAGAKAQGGLGELRTYTKGPQPPSL